MQSVFLCVRMRSGVFAVWHDLFVGDFISINIFIWCKYCKFMYIYLQCRSMQHCKCDTLKNNISDEINEPISDTHPYITMVSELSLAHSHTCPHKKRTKQFRWIEMLVALAWFFVSLSVLQITWWIELANKMDGNYGRKSVMLHKTHAKKSTCKFYSMNLNLHNNESLVT